MVSLRLGSNPRSAYQMAIKSPPRLRLRSGRAGGYPYYFNPKNFNLPVSFPFWRRFISVNVASGNESSGFLVLFAVVQVNHHDAGQDQQADHSVHGVEGGLPGGGVSALVGVVIDPAKIDICEGNAGLFFDTRNDSSGRLIVASPIRGDAPQGAERFFILPELYVRLNSYSKRKTAAFHLELLRP